MKQSQLRQLTEISLFAPLFVWLSSLFVFLWESICPFRQCSGGSRSIDLWCQKGRWHLTRSRHLRFTVGICFRCLDYHSRITHCLFHFAFVLREIPQGK